MTDVRRQIDRDPLLEALVELARSALENRRETADRRRRMAVVEPPKRGGRAA